MIEVVSPTMVLRENGVAGSFSKFKTSSFPGLYMEEIVGSLHKENENLCGAC